MEEIDLESLSEERFSLTDSVNSAKGILQELTQEQVMIEGNFKYDEWIFVNKLDDTRIFFQFNEVHLLTYKIEPNEFKIMVKCWVGDLLDKYSPHSVRGMYQYLLESIAVTQGFQEETIDELIDYLKENNRVPQVSSNIIKVIFNFLDFTELEVQSVYIKELIEIKSKIKPERSIRELPFSKDVLTFSWCLERFFAELDHSSEIDEPLMGQKLLYYPLLIWWKLTNVIPLRPSEFCLIERNCISEADDKYFIRLPRKKRPKTKRRLEIVDTLEISEEIFDLINYYIVETNQYGSTETLISYRSIIEVSHPIEKQARVRKRNYDKFSSSILRTLIERFYRKIVEEKYYKEVDKKVKPNDTRHFAFCSLLMQGIDPVEIARLGGHSTIEAQYHYSQHTEYFIDSEVYNLMINFKHERELQKENDNPFSTLLVSKIKNQSLKAPITNTRLPLKFGFCTDIQQRCESSDCVFCSKWWISPEALLENEETLINKMKNSKKKIYELSNFINQLHRRLDFDESSLHPSVLSKLKSKAMSVEEELNRIAKLESLRGDMYHV
ncbi:tyrosine-type recombinase/integrase [Virgibacillus byunsanensis]|uniref:Tyrosine-type recombinase/integrase n=1 Tax=Virgibacillus byunsanensis TaxID=570945 RepID=A0ABW3LFW9_9BACI